jgi:hypothetical protein
MSILCSLRRLPLYLPTPKLSSLACAAVCPWPLLLPCHAVAAAPPLQTRDLPYSWDFFVENVMDPTHVDFVSAAGSAQQLSLVWPELGCICSGAAAGVTSTAQPLKYVVRASNACWKQAARACGFNRNQLWLCGIESVWQLWVLLGKSLMSPPSAAAMSLQAHHGIAGFDASEHSSRSACCCS